MHLVRGVGKSTIVVNLALALSRTGVELVLVDADIYDASIPLMFNVVNQKPQVHDNKSKKNWKYGI